jgi:IS5 family transposase
MGANPSAVTHWVAIWRLVNPWSHLRAHLSYLKLAPAIGRITKRGGRAPAAVTADRGSGEACVEAELRGLGVKTVAIPRKGQPGAARRATEHRRGFRDLIKWRTGCEGRISHLKHRYDWARSAVAGRDRTAAWCGYGVFATTS